MVFRTAGAITTLLIGLGMSAGDAFSQYYPPQAYGYPGAFNPYFGGSAPPGWTGMPVGYNPGTPGGTPPMALPGAPGRVIVPEQLIPPATEKK